MLRLPPYPDPQITPARVASMLERSIPASFMASSEATKAYWQNGSIFRLSFRSKKSSGLNPFISQANFVLKFSGSNLVISPAPLLPIFMFSQKICTVFPNGVKAPRPVITTLLMQCRLNIDLCFNVV